MRPKFIACCTPTLGSTSVEWASILRAMAWPMNIGYTNFFVRDEVGREIAEARNRCVQLALEYDNERHELSEVFWLDDDVLVMNRLALLVLRGHNRPIASGVYFTKCEPSEPLLFPGRGCGTAPFPAEGAHEMWGHGMGLALVRTEVYRRMLKELDLGVDKYGRPAWYRTTGYEHAEVDGDVVWTGGTEDLYFLENASKLGYKPLVDCTRAAFGWHYDRDKDVGFPLKQWKQWRGGESITWDTEKGAVEWQRPKT
jgi:hypothetical protein